MMGKMAKSWRAALVAVALLAVSSAAFAAVWSTNGFKKVTDISWDGEKKRMMFQLENGVYANQGKAANGTYCEDKGYFEVRNEDGATQALALLTSVMLSGKTVKVMVRTDLCGAYGASLVTLITAH